MIDFKKIAEDAASKAAEAIDQQVPDGIVQGILGQFLEAFGEALAAAGRDLAGSQNADLDG